MSSLTYVISVGYHCSEGIFVANSLICFFSHSFNDVLIENNYSNLFYLFIYYFFIQM